MRNRFIEAEKILNTVIIEAKSLGMAEICGYALHDQVLIASARRDYLTSIRLSQAILADTSIITGKDSALFNLSASFIGHGDHQAAKKIMMPLLRRTQEEGVRQLLLINLLEIAAKDGDRNAFNEYHQKLDGTLTLPMPEAYYYLYLGKGYHTFGSPAAAMEYRQRALAIAEEHGLNQVRSFILDDLSPVVPELSQARSDAQPHSERPQQNTTADLLTNDPE
jgi:tetratricopeptide (TPR) repeat protein